MQAVPLHQKILAIVVNKKSVFLHGILYIQRMKVWKTRPIASQPMPKDVGHAATTVQSRLLYTLVINLAGIIPMTMTSCTHVQC